MIGENFADPVELEEQYQDQTCYLRIKEEFDDPQTMKQLQTIFQKHSGYIPVVMYHEKESTESSHAGRSLLGRWK